MNSIGWRGIRQRKKNLEKLLRNVIEKTHAEGRPVRIVDIAAGGGRYVLETMRALPEIPMTALLRDYKQENVDAASRLAQELRPDECDRCFRRCLRSRLAGRDRAAPDHWHCLRIVRTVSVE